ncbi:hypothetical protein N599_03440 [Saccharopolyspora erythraea D]|nr:hypothetical protein N599_03440 [Saccharopolyspora erythraea D]
MIAAGAEIMHAMQGIPAGYSDHSQSRATTTAPQ